MNDGIVPIKVLGIEMPIIQSGWSHDRPNFIMETSIHVRPVFILVHRRVYSANLKAGIRTAITKLEQSWDRLNFIMGIPITPTLLWVRSQRIVIGKVWFYWNRKHRLLLLLVDISWKCLPRCCIWWLSISKLIFSNVGRKWDLVH